MNGLLNICIINVHYRHEAASQPDLGVQLDVFEEQRESDEAQGPGGINLNSHLDVFYAILKQVLSTFKYFNYSCYIYYSC